LHLQLIFKCFFPQNSYCVGDNGKGNNQAPQNVPTATVTSAEMLPPPVPKVDERTVEKSVAKKSDEGSSSSSSDDEEKESRKSKKKKNKKKKQKEKRKEKRRKAEKDDEDKLSKVC
jgi:hypothetical protein